MVDKQIISKVHARFRQLRNGEVSDNLLAQGIKYHIAWGLESYRLKQIAEEFEQNLELADYLWNEDVRESKMLATRLFPIGEITFEKAIALADGIKYTEIADQICMNFYSKLPFAKELAIHFANEHKDESKMTDYLAISLGTRINAKSAEIENLAKESMGNASPMFLRTAAYWYLQNGED